ncbi:uncharacterized protein LOC134193366 [Corticium candelabrum]|uniref:uncharacterized protein LOC134193366 n=1 Tax=Corticium candelabrum TaxID=121492 RepID=UPI002E2527E6|nr:uncharacterized protein LOC134193366 [Corticium candelabrum]
MADAPPQYVDRRGARFPQQNYVQYQPQLATVINQNPSQPNEHYVFSLFTCLCLCSPLGLMAILLSQRVRECKRLGEYSEAMRVSKFARRLNIAAVVVTVITIISLLVLIIVRVSK